MRKPIDAGAMRHRVTVQSVVTSAPVVSPAGVPPQTAAETWQDSGSFWAYVEPQRIRRSIGVDAPKSSLWSLVTMRNPGFPVTTANRLIFHETPTRDRILVIDGAQRVQEQNAFLEIECTENQD